MNLKSSIIIHVSVALLDPRLRKCFTLCVRLTLSRLNKQGKFPDFRGFWVVCQEYPTQSGANNDVDGNNYCTRIQDLENLLEY